MRELKFRCKAKKFSDFRKWKAVESLQVANTVQGGSTDLGRHMVCNGKSLYGRDYILQQFVDGAWRAVELDAIAFVTVDPKDDSYKTTVTVIPTHSSSPLHVHYYSFFEVECVEKSKPNMRSSCDGRSPIEKLDIWQIVDGKEIAVTV